MDHHYFLSPDNQFLKRALTPFGASSVAISTICCLRLPVALLPYPYLGADVDEARVSVEEDGDAVGVTFGGGLGFLSGAGISRGLGMLL